MSGIDCPYHHLRWRNRTQQVLNALRVRLQRSSKHLKQFSSLVCVCPGKTRIATPNIQPDRIADLLQWLQNKPSSIPGEILPVLEQYLNAALKLPDGQGAGLAHMVSIIQETIHGKLSSVSKEDNFVEEWNLTVPSSYLGLLIGHDGQHIKSLCNEFGVKIFFGERLQVVHKYGKRWHHLHVVNTDSPVVKVTVVSKNREGINVQAIQQRLEELVKCLVIKRERHEAHVLKNKKWLQARRQQPVKQLRAYRIRPFGVYTNSKEAAIEHYERKYQQKTKTRHPSRSVQHNAISDGHCLNCLLPYSPNHTHQGACTFHPGFITAIKKAGKNRGYKWTCCGRRTAEHRATIDLHTRTGCSSGRHTWRAGRCSTRKTKDTLKTHHTTDIIVY